MIVFEDKRNGVFEKDDAFDQFFDIQLMHDFFPTFEDVLDEGPLKVFLHFLDNVVEVILNVVE
jgi:hypothetical protein